jgi:hypothetical protein
MDTEAVHVIVDKSTEELTSLGVEFGGTSTWPAPLIGTAAPVQILQRRPTRSKAIIRVDSLGGSQASQVQTPPSAGANFTYTNNTGAPQTLLAASALFTASAAVANRFVGYQLQDSANNFIAQDIDTTAITASNAVNIRAYQGATHQNAGSGTTLLALPQNVVIPVGGKFTFTASAIDAADTFTNISLTFAGVGAASAVVLAYRPDYLASAANPQGFFIASVPCILQWENQQPCYAAAIGAGPVTVNTIDQAQAASQATAEEALEMDSYPDELDQMEGARYGGGRDANQY